MSPIAIGLDILLAALLCGALGMGWKLNGRLKALRASQADFAQAVVELDAAAARAENGLTALKAAAEEAHDSLLARIDTARSLAAKLEKAEMSADAAARRAETAAADVKAATPLVSPASPSRAEPRAAQPGPRRRNVADEALFAEAETDVRPSLQGLMRLSLNARR
jgi:hypothetical protein